MILEQADLNGINADIHCEQRFQYKSQKVRDRFSIAIFTFQSSNMMIVIVAPGIQNHGD